MANIEKRISDLEAKTNDQEGDQRVIVDWGIDDPELPGDDDIIIKWVNDDNIETA